MSIKVFKQCNRKHGFSLPMVSVQQKKTTVHTKRYINR